MTSSGSAIGVTKKCGLTELMVFVVAIISGTANSICRKIMMELRSTGLAGVEGEQFNKPIFQTLGMFLGMSFGLVMHAAVVYFQIPFPGYEHSSSDATGTAAESTRLLATSPKFEAPPPPKKSLPLSRYCLLSVPSIFDLAATVMCMIGLQFVDVSIFQMLRGSGIIFVALIKQHVRKHFLYSFQWLGVVWNAVGVILAGLTAILNSSDSGDVEGQSAATNKDAGHALLGVLLIVGGTLLHACNLILEEKVMTDMDVPALLLVGMEGLWGTILCLVLVYPLAYFLPGSDYGGCYENPWNTWVMIVNSSTIQIMFAVFFVAVFSYNLFGALLMFLFNSVWKAMLANFRPITVWLFDLFIYYVLTPQTLGEPWTPFSYLQLVALAILMYGSAIYNAPNPGSVVMRGEWYHGGLNFSTEYQAIERAMHQTEENDEWMAKQLAFQAERLSSNGDGTTTV